MVSEGSVELIWAVSWACACWAWRLRRCSRRRRARDGGTFKGGGMVGMALELLEEAGGAKSCYWLLAGTLQAVDLRL